MINFLTQVRHSTGQMKNKNSKQKVKEDILLAMYRSITRANKHWVNGNNAGVIAERFYQQNLRNNFDELGA